MLAYEGNYVCEFAMGKYNMHDRMKICGKVFQTQAALNNHKLEHCPKYMYTRTRLLECEDCPKKFRFLHELDYHKRNHLRELNYRCALCPKTMKSFRFREELVDHLKEAHKDQKKNAYKEVEKLWEQRQWAAPENGAQAYMQSRKQYNSQDSDGEPREQNPIGVYFFCTYCNRKFSVFHSKVNHETIFCKKRWSMKANRNVKEAGGQLLQRKKDYLNHKPLAVLAPQQQYSRDKFDFSDNKYEHLPIPFSKPPVETIEIDKEPYAWKKK